MLGTHFQAQLDCFADTPERLVLRDALAHAAGNCWALDNPHPVFVTIDRYAEFHHLVLRSLQRAIMSQHASGNNTNKVCPYLKT